MKSIIRKIVQKTAKIISHQLVADTSQNIRLERTHRALVSTVDYIETNMINVLSVDSKWKVHDIALSHIAIEDGLYLEFGVFTGETINYIAQKTNNQVFGFDSFEGLPEFWRDGFEKGRFSTGRLPQVKQNVTLIKGWFDQTASSFIASHSGTIVYLHIDCDLYSSTKTIFDTLQTRIVPCTVIVFDEYFNYPGWQNGEYKAFQEFTSGNGLDYEYLTYNFMHEQVAVKITEKI